jgi:DNA (cytosine-5)-methyltransferase 1
MEPLAYYNEIDKYAAEWLGNLMTAGHIARGVIDTRGIEDVKPSDLAGFTQCHFFAGIGVWSYALRQAGWPDDRKVWTGSCPCQPFSPAGKGAGFADERHLWPDFYHLIRECRPAAVVGEQVASKDAGPWIDLVHTDLEALGYAFGAVPFPSAGVGAPHIRDRLYWMANADIERRLGEHALLLGVQPGRVSQDRIEIAGGGVASGLANAQQEQRGRWPTPEGSIGHDAGERQQGTNIVEPRGGVDRLVDTLGARLEGHSGQHGLVAQDDGVVQLRPAGPVNGYWEDVDWLYCRDGKWRPVEPGTFPLAHGAPARVGRLRAYGNAINAQAAIAFIDAALNSNVS